MISYIHEASDHRQCCHVGNAARHCRLGLFQDADFAGDLEDSKSTSGRILRIFGCRTFIPTSWIRKKKKKNKRQSVTIPLTAVTSLDDGLRMDGIPALAR